MLIFFNIADFYFPIVVFIMFHCAYIMIMQNVSGFRGLIIYRNRNRYHFVIVTVYTLRILLEYIFV